MNPLSKILDDAMRRLDLGEAALDARAVMLWAEVVGPQMAKASEAQKVQAGTLLVTARSSAWNQELTFQRQTILRRYRERLGKDYIKDLRFTVGPVRGVVDPSASHNPPEAEVRRIRLPEAEVARIQEASQGGDPELSQAIRRALTREAQLREWRLRHGAKACPRCGAAFRTQQDLCPACRQDDATADAPL